MSVKYPKTLNLAAALIFVAAVSLSAQYKPLYYSDMPKVSASYDTVLQKTWEGIKTRNVDAYTTGLIHRPKSEYPGDAVSEGVSYGMFLALYCNDQEYFNKIWNAGENYMWNSGGYYDWHRNSQGGGSGVGGNQNGPASDADQDIALLLIFADELVKAGIWQSGYKSMRNATYAQRAASMMPNLLAMTAQRDGSANRYLLPGGWGGVNHLNPGYFAPAFYRIFAEFDPSNAAAWNALVEGSYEVIGNSPGYGKGLLPDWCGWNGNFTSGGAGYNGYRGGIYQYRDAIRVYWRLATDYLWYGEPRAKAFLDNAVAFLGSPDKANFFDMDGNLPPEADGEMLNGGTIPRTRREHSHLTLGMWAAAAMGSGGPALAQGYSDLLLQKFYASGRDFFGQINIPAATLDSLIIVKDSDPSAKLLNVQFAEDTLRNEMYFDQFLAWFGASLLGGRFTNVWEDLKGGVPTGPLAWKTQPPVLLPNWNIDASVNPFTLGASFTRAANWTATLTHDSSAAQTKTFSGNSDTVNVVWYGLNDAGGYMRQGYYTLTISAGGLNYTARVWLGRPYAGNVPNLREGRRLLVDDFADGDMVPYIGRAWQTFSDMNNNGGNSFAVMTPTAKNGSTDGRLEWDYQIRAGYQYAFAALEWNCMTPSGVVIDLTGIDSIIIVARSKTSTLGVSVQLIDTDDPNDYTFFEDSITLTTSSAAASKTHALRLSSTNFKQRIGGSNRNFAETLTKMRALRFHMQYPTNAAQSSDAIIVERLYLSGSEQALSRLYTPPSPPPEYIPPPDDPISVAHRADMNTAKFAIKRAGSSIRVTLPGNMAGADVRIIDVRGRAVKRTSVPQSGSFDISVRNMAAGVYFMEIKKHGKAAVKVRLGNVR